MMRKLVVGLTIAAMLFVLVQSAAARNPGGRNYGGAIFSAGVSGKDGGPKAVLLPLTPALDALTRVSDDTGLPDTLASWELNQSGRAFLNSETEPWLDVNPENPDIILLGVDQGATITVNGGRTWSSWYNQPTAQFYHVSTDDRFPYWIYGAQQDNTTVAIASRGREGSIGVNDWYAVGGGIFAVPGSPVTLKFTVVAKNIPDNCAPPGTIPGCKN